MMRSAVVILFTLSTSHPSALLGQSAPPQNSPAVEVVDPRKPIPVADATTLIEEKSLLLDSSLASMNADKVEQFRSGYVSTDPTSSGRGGLATRTGMTDSESAVGNGLRLYAFDLKPKEELKLKLKSEDSQLVMRFLMPTSPDAFGKEIRRANLPPTPVRRSQIAITNSTAAPVRAVMMLTGPMNHKFVLEVQRKISN